MPYMLNDYTIGEQVTNLHVEKMQADDGCFQAEGSCDGVRFQVRAVESKQWAGAIDLDASTFLIDGVPVKIVQFMERTGIRWRVEEPWTPSTLQVPVVVYVRTELSVRWSKDDRLWEVVAKDLYPDGTTINHIVLCRSEDERECWEEVRFLSTPKDNPSKPS